MQLLKKCGVGCQYLSNGYIEGHTCTHKQVSLKSNLILTGSALSKSEGWTQMT